MGTVVRVGHAVPGGQERAWRVSAPTTTPHGSRLANLCYACILREIAKVADGSLLAPRHTGDVPLQASGRSTQEWRIELLSTLRTMTQARPATSRHGYSRGCSTSNRNSASSRCSTVEPILEVGSA